MIEVTGAPARLDPKPSDEETMEGVAVGLLIDDILEAAKGEDRERIKEALATFKEL